MSSLKEKRCISISCLNPRRQLRISLNRWPFAAFWDMVLGTAGHPQTCFAAEAGLELLILLPSLLWCSYYRHVLSHLFPLQRRVCWNFPPSFPLAPDSSAGTASGNYYTLLGWPFFLWKMLSKDNRVGEGKQGWRAGWRHSPRRAHEVTLETLPRTSPGRTLCGIRTLVGSTCHPSSL